MKTVIGIDPGVNTGWAVTDNGELTQVETFTMTEAQHWILRMNGNTAHRCGTEGRTIELVIEDPRGQYVPKGDPRYGTHRLKGVGSVERDTKLWIEFAEFYGFKYRLVKPGKYRKINDKAFRKMTGWDMRTSEHARAAAMMVWQGKKMNPDHAAQLTKGALS